MFAFNFVFTAIADNVIAYKINIRIIQAIVYRFSAMIAVGVMIHGYSPIDKKVKVTV